MKRKLSISNRNLTVLYLCKKRKKVFLFISQLVDWPLLKPQVEWANLLRWRNLILQPPRLGLGQQLLIAKLPPPRRLPRGKFIREVHRLSSGERKDLENRLLDISPFEFWF